MSLDPIVKALIQRRKDNGYTRKQIAEICGMSTKTYERIERGDSDMHLNQYRAILRALKLTDLDIALDILKIDQVTANDVAAASRVLKPDSRKLLVKLLLNSYHK